MKKLSVLNISAESGSFSHLERIFLVLSKCLWLRSNDFWRNKKNEIET